MSLMKAAGCNSVVRMVQLCDKREEGRIMLNKPTLTLERALAEVGPIEPWLDTNTGTWVFESPRFPDMEIEGDSREEVIALYPRFLAEHLRDLDAGKVAARIAAITPGWGGVRPGAGRPKGTQKPSPSKRISVDAEIAEAIALLGQERVKMILKQALSG
jgi:hypothetical protein